MRWRSAISPTGCAASGAFVQAWPRDERVLTSAERYELQQLLVARGFDIGGEPNGRINAKTRNALKGFQASIGLVPDGFATAAVLDRLRGLASADATPPRR